MKTIITYIATCERDGQIDVVRVPSENNYTDFTKAEVLMTQTYQGLVWHERDALAKKLVEQVKASLS